MSEMDKELIAPEIIIKKQGLFFSIGEQIHSKF